MVACLKLSPGLGFGVGQWTSSSIPTWYPCCLCPTYYFVSLVLQLVMKMVFPMMFWVLTWIFVEPPSLAWTAIPGSHWLRRCSWSFLRPELLLRGPVALDISLDKCYQDQVKKDNEIIAQWCIILHTIFNQVYTYDLVTNLLYHRWY